MPKRHFVRNRSNYVVWISLIRDPTQPTWTGLNLMTMSQTKHVMACKWHTSHHTVQETCLGLTEKNHTLGFIPDGYRRIDFYYGRAICGVCYDLHTNYSENRNPCSLKITLSQVAYLDESSHEEKVVIDLTRWVLH